MKKKGQSEIIVLISKYWPYILLAILLFILIKFMQP